MSTYLYRIRPDRPELLTDGPTPDEKRVISEHFEYLSGLADEGVVLLAGRTQSQTTDDFGLVILFAGSMNDAREVMENDPAVRDGVFVGDLFVYRVSLHSKDILKLLADLS
ncbi:MAG: hypothetical protein GF405_00010 [Candidatus Eisenbacteria bacterium]|nr:hypothetical protein [Candidatus Eisenbacteria bacterium]